MKIELLKVDELIPYPNNPRINEEAVGAVAYSIKKFGFKVPILLDKDKVIITGHTRLKAAKKLSLKEIPCIIAKDLSEEQAKALRLADNKVGEIATWDWGLLEREKRQLLDAIEKLELDLDLEEFGFEVEEGEFDIKEPEEEEELPEKIEARCKEGDVWKLGEHKLLCGDATKEENIKKLMQNKKGMIFTDPPYGIKAVKSGMVGADFGVAKKGEYKEIISDDTTKIAQEFYEQCVSLGFSDFIIWGGNYFIDFLPFSDSWLIWNKRAGTDIRNTFADGEMAWCSFHTPIRIYDQLWNGMIREGEKEKRLHPTQKPVRMLSEIIEDHVKKDLVFDGFLGSGSTLIACENVGKKCYGIELDPYYCDVTITRWEQKTGKKAKKE